jgi:hypothetical protein
MKIQRLLVVLTAVNFLLLIFLLAQGPVQANNESSVLRGRGLEIVDEKGRVRASIKIHPADPTFRWEDGKRGYPETVLLRLITSEGRPNVKLAAMEDGSGISLGGEENPTYAALGAQGGEAKLRLMGKDGKLKMITP